MNLFSLILEAILFITGYIAQSNLNLSHSKALPLSHKCYYSWGVFEEDGQKNAECTHSRRVEFHWRLEHFPDAFGGAVRVSVRSFYGNWSGLSASGPCLNSPPWPKQECIAGDHSLCSHLSFPGILHLEFQIYQLYRENLLTDLCRYIRKWNKHCLWSSFYYAQRS